MFVLLILVICLLVAGATYVVLLQLDILPGWAGADRGFGRDRDGGIPRLGNLPQGCLLTILVVGTLWFLFWGVVLILGLRLLNTPFDG